MQSLIRTDQQAAIPADLQLMHSEKTADVSLLSQDFLAIEAVAKQHQDAQQFDDSTPVNH